VEREEEAGRTERPGIGDGPSLILVGLDGSETSLRAAAWAGGQARRNGSRLVARYVATTSPLAGLAPGAGVGAAARTEIARDLRQLVDEGAAYYGVDARFVVRQGDPYTEFLRIAEETRADAVVVGVSTHAGHRLMGSLAVKLVRAGRWPVTVVP
jgi:nucleotide-binding universal stress UspA family protein